MVSVCTVPARGGRSCEHFGGYKTINRIPLPLLVLCIIVTSALEGVTHKFIITNLGHQNKKIPKTHISLYETTELNVNSLHI